MHIYECWCNERLKAKAEGSTRLTYKHLKIETRLRDERFESVKGERFVSVKVFLWNLFLLLNNR